MLGHMLPHNNIISPPPPERVLYKTLQVYVCMCICMQLYVCECVVANDMCVSEALLVVFMFT